MFYQSTKIIKKNSFFMFVWSEFSNLIYYCFCDSKQWFNRVWLPVIADRSDQPVVTEMMIN